MWLDSQRGSWKKEPWKEGELTRRGLDRRERDAMDSENKANRFAQNLAVTRRPIESER